MVCDAVAPSQAPEVAGQDATSSPHARAGQRRTQSPRADEGDVQADCRGEGEGHRSGEVVRAGLEREATQQDVRHRDRQQLNDCVPLQSQGSRAGQDAGREEAPLDHERDRRQHGADGLKRAAVPEHGPSYQDREHERGHQRQQAAAQEPAGDRGDVHERQGQGRPQL
eukprot:CAMPEP_0175407410 /NCGR_PEP_ID=MMETSP0095-20121207/40065_1 /TAXON_ID=311494 /ORGANISM="Alexandrium monilatum, Strain CCMP3105" /LENGTH=167 /DNA_ID=CAMNT_0016706301 /DNA_START=31 /DNA_END=531 /DNA_ORIENTATION=-